MVVKNNILEELFRFCGDLLASANLPLRWQEELSAEPLNDISVPSRSRLQGIARLDNFFEPEAEAALRNLPNRLWLYRVVRESTVCAAGMATPRMTLAHVRQAMVRLRANAMNKFNFFKPASELGETEAQEAITNGYLLNCWNKGKGLPPLPSVMPNPVFYGRLPG